MNCKTCGQDNPTEASFCGNCGATLVAEVEPPSPVAEFGPPKLPGKTLLVGIIIAVLAIAGISVGLSLLSDGTETPPPTDMTQVAFSDASLEIAIRETINKPEGPIFVSDLKSLTMLEVQERGISDLTGLEHCTNLRWLALIENNISDISALAGLTNLDWLDLWNNNISDISPLAGLTNLLSLSLGVNNISDISPLVNNSGLAAGDTVDLRNNPLSTTSVDVYIPQLEARGVTVVY